METHELRRLIDSIQNLMIDVALGELRIQEVDAGYIELKRTIGNELRRLGLDDPNLHGDLWQWYMHWRDELPSWAERRVYVRKLYAPILDALDHLEQRSIGTGITTGETGWERVDSQVRQLRERYATARTVEDFQAVGLLCRDIFVSLADAAFDPDRHVPGGEAAPESVSERLYAVCDFEAPGASNKELRKLLKAGIDFANKVQHDRMATVEDAAIVAEATVASVRLVKLLTFAVPEIGEERHTPESAIPELES